MALLELFLNLPIGHSFQEAQLVGHILQNTKYLSIPASQHDDQMQVAEHTPRPSRVLDKGSLGPCNIP